MIGAKPRACEALRFARVLGVLGNQGLRPWTPESQAITCPPNRGSSKLICAQRREVSGAAHQLNAVARRDLPHRQRSSAGVPSVASRSLDKFCRGLWSTGERICVGTHELTKFEGRREPTLESLLFQEFLDLLVFCVRPLRGYADEIPAVTVGVYIPLRRGQAGLLINRFACRLPFEKVKVLAWSEVENAYEHRARLARRFLHLTNGKRRSSQHESSEHNPDPLRNQSGLLSDQTVYAIP